LAESIWGRLGRGELAGVLALAFRIFIFSAILRWITQLFEFYALKGARLRGFMPDTSSEKLTEQQVRHVAKLSRLNLSDDEVHHFSEQLSGVLGYVSKLNELDVTGVEPMAHAMDVTNALREDVAEPGLTAGQALANAPATDEPFFKVPKVIGDGGGA
jgi:aspartyl-tRNA(Asn)/glutamyl-tRNA(Gln) amidotransferase subunit C